MRALRPASKLAATVLATTAFAAIAVSLLTSLTRDSELGPRGSGWARAITIAKLTEVACRAAPAGPEVAFLGDSTVIGYPAGRRLPDALHRALVDADRSRVHVVPIAVPGMNALDFLVVASRLSRCPVSAVVLPVNLASFSESWRTNWSRLELTGWLPLSQDLRAMRLPLHWYGLTLDRLLLNQAIVRAGAEELWNGIQGGQIRAGKWLEDLRIRLRRDRRSLYRGLPPQPLSVSLRRRKRESASHFRAVYAVALRGAAPSHPVIQTLGATVRELERSGVRTVAYVVPMNVEWGAEIGVSDDDGLARTVRSIRAELSAAGAEVLDLHRLLPDAGFRDGYGHFSTTDSHDGPDQVAAALLQRLLTDLPADGAARPGS